jgi:hypothetical protein
MSEYQLFNKHLSHEISSKAISTSVGLSKAAHGALSPESSQKHKNGQRSVPDSKVARV